MGPVRTRHCLFFLRSITALAKTRGKRPKEFAVMRFEPSADGVKVSAALLWRKRATREGGGFRLIVASRSPQTRRAELIATLQSLDSPATPPVRERLSLDVSAEAREVYIRRVGEMRKLADQISGEYAGKAADPVRPRHLNGREKE